MSSLRLIALLIIGALAAGCREDRSRVRVAGVPTPPRPPSVPTVHVPEVPFGSTGPEARIVSVSDASTGAPVSLTSIRDSVRVLTLVAFGPDDQPTRSDARLELIIAGASNRLLTMALSAPVPVIISHAFSVGGLRPGAHTVSVRLVGAVRGEIARSIPLHLFVAP